MKKLMIIFGAILFASVFLTGCGDSGSPTVYEDAPAVEDAPAATVAPETDSQTEDAPAVEDAPAATVAPETDSQTEEVVQKINIGSTYSLDRYHQIKFKSANRYWIYQKPLSCGGEGNWSQSGDKIVLGPNDSNCESTRKINGEYSINEILY
jgi:hypothetical protein